MRYFVMLMLTLAVISQCLANDTMMVGTGGSLRPMTGEHKSIRMVREWVRMDVHPTYYDVSVQFVFRNDGPATTVQMGFPEFNSGGMSRDFYRNRSGYKWFHTSIDGRRVPAKRVYVEDPKEEFQQKAYWVKTVDFSRNQERVIRVDYRSDGGEDSMGGRYAEYNFTGKNWAGTVDESSIAVVMHTPGVYYMRNVPPGTTRVGNRFSNRWTNWQAEMPFGLVYAPTYQGAMLLQGDALGFQPRNEFFIEQPGRTPSPAWAPDVIVLKGTAFVRMQSLRDFLDGQARKKGRSITTSKTWDPKTNTVTLVTSEHQLVFRVGEREMKVDGRAVALSAAPFRMPRNQYSDPGIYVPLKPVADALGGTVSVDAETRTVRLDLPS